MPSRPTQLIAALVAVAIILLSAHSLQRGLPYGDELARSARAAMDQLPFGGSGGARTSSSHLMDDFSCPPPPALPDTRLKILSLIDEPTMQSLMDRWFMRSQLGFASETDIVADAPLWGRGFEGYDDNLSLTRNIELRYGSATYFDAVIPYYNSDQVADQGLDPAPYFRDLLELSSHGVIIIDRPHEMRDGRRWPIMDGGNVSLVLSPYPHEIIDHAERYQRNVLLVHQPHPIEERMFTHPIYTSDGGLVDRPTDVLLAGNLDGSFYPLRVRLALMMDAETIPGGVRPHPGYPDTLSEAERLKNHINADSLEAQLRDYSADFGKAKICLVTSSMWMYSVQKYGEAAAAGCLIIGSIPLDRRTDFQDFVVEIKNTDSDEKIARTINKWLRDDRARAGRAARGQRYFLAKFAHRRYVEDVVTWVRRAQAGQRGLVLPYEWHLLPDPLPIDG